MALVDLCRRALMKLARWDERDWFKPLIVRIARLVAESPVAVSTASLSGAIKYTFPEAENDWALMRYQCSPELSGEISISTAGIETWPREASEAGRKPCSRLVALWGQSEPYPSSDNAAEEIRWLASKTTDYLLVSAPTYPDDLLSQPTPGCFERSSWWHAQAIANGLKPVNKPREQFPGLYLHWYRKLGEPEPRRVFSDNPRVHFAMPDRAGAFRWVAEDLSSALIEQGVPAGFRSEGSAERVVTWAHYWPDHNVVVDRRDAEVFVTNFRFSPEGPLTAWLGDLLKRDCTKLCVSKFAADALGDLGVPRDQIRVVPHGYSPEFTYQIEPLSLSTDKTFRLLAVVNSYDPNRYGVDLLLAAAGKAFSADDDVCIVVKDYGADCERIKQSIDAVGPGGPEFLYFANFMSKPDLARFYKACSAFVAPFRGEGFGMKILDAAVIGLPLILPLYGGPTDYCDPQLVWPVAFDEVEVGNCMETRELDWNETITWCEPRFDDLARQMRAVYEHQAEAGRRAEALRAQVIGDFSWAKAAEKLREALEL